MPQAFRDFEEFWPYYVSQHRDPTCRLLHVTGTAIAASCVALSPFAPALLLAAPLAGYGLAWIGHFVFEKNKPATFQHPLWSLRGDFRMFRLTLTQRMGDALEKSGQIYS